jgi:translation initiation factor 3 subunit F
VSVHPSALFGILDHYLRRTDAQPRVIGTLLGTRAADGSGAIDVTGAFAVLHSETAEQVAVDSGYHRNMLELAQRTSPREHIVGWSVHSSWAWRAGVLMGEARRYSTGGSLDTYSSLIQNFYTQETAPAAAVHVVLDAGVAEGAPPAVKAYISCAAPFACAQGG